MSVNVFYENKSKEWHEGYSCAYQEVHFLLRNKGISNKEIIQRIEERAGFKNLMVEEDR